MASFFVLFLLIQGAGICEAKTVNLSWDASPTETVVGYIVWTSLNQQMASAAPQDVGNVLTLTIPGLEDTLAYWFCVKAYDGNGNQSVCSNVVKSPAVEVPEDVLPELDFLDFDISVEILQ